MFLVTKYYNYNKDINITSVIREIIVKIRKRN